MITLKHEQWRNSFKEAHIWLKGELLDLKGMSDAL